MKKVGIGAGTACDLSLAPPSGRGYVEKMMSSTRLPLLAVLLLPAGSFHSAADDLQDPLPGVERQSGIVAPVPESGADAPVESSPYGQGFMRIPGTDTYVRIGGEIRYEIQFSDE